MPTFPLVTLAPMISATGITAPSYSDILNSLIASFQSIYGSDVLLTPDTQDYQMLAVFALAINDCNQAIIAAYNGFLPTAAQGAALSSLVKINGITRNVATNSTATVTIVGVAGTVILNGVVQDTQDQLWNLPPNVVIPGGGSVDVTATAQVQGALTAPAGTINKIFTPTAGWQSVTNTTDATVGAAIETDAALRTRQAVSTSLPAQTPLQAIIAAVANVSGVSRYAIYENPSGTVDSNGVPAHSIAVVVLGGDPVAIATAIEEKKSPGTGTFGTTSETIEDPAGVPVTINFFQLTTVTIYVVVNIHTQTGYVGSTADAIKNAVASFINALPIGDTVHFNWVLSVAALTSSPLGLTFNITSLFTGTAPAPTGVVDINIPFNQAAATVIANITVNLV